ncbi:MAG: nucleotidyltransferase domain-containing protein [Oscillospiraceae bacterium]|nr:nucleotidyltransferase domain-containing protein [Oscillospiraceae bacterium]
MKEIIAAKLAELEKAENVRVLHAVESGSRAWGFASPDSDYDVRFIYVRPKEFYLKLERTRDVIEWQLDETLDINGWDLQKALRLLHRSNPTLFEWNSSPIVYKTTAEWDAVRAEIDRYFSAKSGLYHYLSTANTNYREFLKGDMVKLKKYFYVVRPLLACKWILEKRCPPPMLFGELAEAELEADMKPIIDDLLWLKRNSPEMGEGRRINKLNAYIDENLLSLRAAINAMPREQSADWGKLNELFLSVIG